MSGSEAPRPASDDEPESLQRNAFGYFLHEADAATGLVRDSTHDGSPASIAAVGLALTVYPVAVSRGFMERTEAAARVLATLRFFFNAPQGEEPDASGHHGFFYHFLDMGSGRRAWDCEISTIDTAYLMAGALACAAYFDGREREEREIRDMADAFYCRCDWRWALNGSALLSHGWKPERGFLPYRWTGYSEALILYLLALGSPTHPISPRSYAAFTSSYRFRKLYGIELLYAAPLFIHQLSHVWIDFREIRDAAMRRKGLDYFENSRRATFVQQRYAMHNPKKFAGYGEWCWGITASEGPGPVTLEVDGVTRHFFDYVARGVPRGPDDGTLAPWAVVASLPFVPEIVMPTIANFHAMGVGRGPYGFEATFNPTFPTNTKAPCGWVSPYNFGLNDGPILLMVENHRTGLVWELMRRCPYLVRGLLRAGFRGGWLEKKRS
ncbi:MAG TPA: glucoamylase family protein [Thermoanaerobaculia bacterium]